MKESKAAPHPNDDFDADALRRKYEQERAKRLLADGPRHFRFIDGELTSFLDDPYVTSVPPREAWIGEVEVAIIGGGFGGLLAAARLRDAGIDDILIIEKAGDFGGVWYWK